MILLDNQKELIKNKIRKQLSGQQEIEKIVLFGSFVRSSEPNDIDVAIFQNSTESYLSLDLKYRKLLREIANMLPVDVIPLKTSASGLFLNEIESGEVIYDIKDENNFRKEKTGQRDAWDELDLEAISVDTEI